MKATQANPALTRERRIGLARVLSKQGICSRSEAARWIASGRVRLNGRIVRDPEQPVFASRDRIRIDDQDLPAAERIYLLLNKPRGLVCTAQDEKGRATVYRCFDGAQWHGQDLPWLAPVGRLDKASEGALLFSNDPQWASAITDPKHGLHKTYHVQIDRLADADLLAALQHGVSEQGERLAAVSARLLRHGQRNCWLELVLDEGRNRHIRRLLVAHDIGVLRLLRVAIGDLQLGTLGKGQWRELDSSEVAALVAGRCRQPIARVDSQHES